MTIKEFHDSARELANIGQSQYLPPETIDLQLNNAINEMFSQEYGHFESSQEITDTLGFYKAATAPLTLSNAQASLPSDFYHMTEVEAIMEDDSRVPCELLKDSEWLRRKHSKGFAPSEIHPIARSIGNKIVEILPASVKSVVVFYLRKPDTAKYGYTISSNQTSFIYNELTSTQVDYPEPKHQEIQDKLVGLLGVILRDNTLIGHEGMSKTLNESKG